MLEPAFRKNCETASMSLVEKFAVFCYYHDVKGVMCSSSGSERPKYETNPKAAKILVFLAPCRSTEPTMGKVPPSAHTSFVGATSFGDGMLSRQ